VWEVAPVPVTTNLLLGPVMRCCVQPSLVGLILIAASEHGNLILEAPLLRQMGEHVLGNPVHAIIGRNSDGGQLERLRPDRGPLDRETLIEKGHVIDVARVVRHVDLLQSNASKCLGIFVGAGLGFHFDQALFLFGAARLHPGCHSGNNDDVLVALILVLFLGCFFRHALAALGRLGLAGTKWLLGALGQVVSAAILPLLMQALLKDLHFQEGLLPFQLSALAFIFDSLKPGMDVVEPLGEAGEVTPVHVAVAANLLLIHIMRCGAGHILIELVFFAAFKHSDLVIEAPFLRQMFVHVLSNPVHAIVISGDSVSGQLERLCAERGTLGQETFIEEGHVIDMAWVVGHVDLLQRNAGKCLGIFVGAGLGFHFDQALFLFGPAGMHAGGCLDRNNGHVLVLLTLVLFLGCSSQHALSRLGPAGSQ